MGALLRIFKLIFSLFKGAKTKEATAAIATQAVNSKLSNNTPAKPENKKDLEDIKNRKESQKQEEKSKRQQEEAEAELESAENAEETSDDKSADKRKQALDKIDELEKNKSKEVHTRLRAKQNRQSRLDKNKARLENIELLLKTNPKLSIKERTKLETKAHNLKKSIREEENAIDKLDIELEGIRRQYDEEIASAKTDLEEKKIESEAEDEEQEDEKRKLDFKAIKAAIAGSFIGRGVAAVGDKIKGAASKVKSTLSTAKEKVQTAAKPENILSSIVKIIVGINLLKVITKGKFDKIADFIVAAATFICDLIARYLPKVVEWILNLAVLVIEAAQRFLPKLLGFLSNLLAKLVEILPRVLTVVGDAIVRLLKNSTSILPLAISFMEKGIVLIASTLVYMIPVIWDTLCKIAVALWGFIKTYVPTYLAFLLSLAQRLLTWIVDVAVPAIVKFVTDFLPKALAWLIGTFHKVLSWLMNNLPNIVKYIFTNIVPKVIAVAWGFIKKLLPALTTIIQQLVNFIVGFVTYVAKYTPAIITWLVNAIVSFVKYIIPKLPAAIWWILTELFPVLLRLVWELVKAIWELVKASFVTLFYAVWAIIKGAWELLKGLVDIIVVFAKTIWDLLKKAWNFIKTLVPKIWKWIKYGMEWLAWKITPMSKEEDKPSPPADDTDNSPVVDPSETPADNSLDASPVEAALSSGVDESSLKSASLPAYAEGTENAKDGDIYTVNENGDLVRSSGSTDNLGRFSNLDESQRIYKLTESNELVRVPNYDHQIIKSTDKESKVESNIRELDENEGPVRSSGSTNTSNKSSNIEEFQRTHKLTESNESVKVPNYDHQIIKSTDKESKVESNIYRLNENGDLVRISGNNNNPGIYQLNPDGSFSKVSDYSKLDTSTLPAYKEGTENAKDGTHPGGPAVVGDGGEPELVIEPSKGVSVTPDTSTVVNLEKGSTVIPTSKLPAYADGTENVSEDDIYDIDENGELVKVSRRKKTPDTSESNESIKPLSQDHQIIESESNNREVNADTPAIVDLVTDATVIPTYRDGTSNVAKYEKITPLISKRLKEYDDFSNSESPENSIPTVATDQSGWEREYAFKQDRARRKYPDDIAAQNAYTSLGYLSDPQYTADLNKYLKESKRPLTEKSNFKNAFDDSGFFNFIKSLGNGIQHLSAYNSGTLKTFVDTYSSLKLGVLAASQYTGVYQARHKQYLEAFRQIAAFLEMVINDVLAPTSVRSNAKINLSISNLVIALYNKKLGVDSAKFDILCNRMRVITSPSEVQTLDSFNEEDYSYCIDTYRRAIRKLLEEESKVRLDWEKLFPLNGDGELDTESESTVVTEVADEVTDEFEEGGVEGSFFGERIGTYTMSLYNQKLYHDKTSHPENPELWGQFSTRREFARTLYPMYVKALKAKGIDSDYALALLAQDAATSKYGEQVHDFNYSGTESKYNSIQEYIDARVDKFKESVGDQSASYNNQVFDNIEWFKEQSNQNAAIESLKDIKSRLRSESSTKLTSTRSYKSYFPNVEPSDTIVFEGKEHKLAKVLTQLNKNTVTASELKSTQKNRNSTCTGSVARALQEQGFSRGTGYEGPKNIAARLESDGWLNVFNRNDQSSYQPKAGDIFTLWNPVRSGKGRKWHTAMFDGENWISYQTGGDGTGDHPWRWKQRNDSDVTVAIWRYPKSSNAVASTESNPNPSVTPNLTASHTTESTTCTTLDGYGAGPEEDLTVKEMDCIDLRCSSNSSSESSKSDLSTINETTESIKAFSDLNAKLSQDILALTTTNTKMLESLIAKPIGSSPKVSIVTNQDNRREFD